LAQIEIAVCDPAAKLDLKDAEDGPADELRRLRRRNAALLHRLRDSASD